MTQKPTLSDPKRIVRPPVPTLAGANPAYAAAIAKRLELDERKAAAVSELNRISRQLSDTATLNERADAARVAAILGEEVAEDTFDLAALQTRYRDLSAEISAIDRARPHLDKRMMAERQNASRVICDLVRDGYNARVAACCTALAALHAAHSDYLSLVDDLAARDVAWSALWPMQMNWLGTDRHGRGAAYLAEAAEHGFIDKSEIPEELRRG